MAQDAASLDNLRDIVLPPPVPWLPPAFGWRLVAAALAAAALVALWRAFARWRANAYRREALRELAAIAARIQAGENPANAAAEISALMKRAALTAFPREAAAELTGRSWASFLDRTGRTKDFTEGPGRDLWPAAFGGAVSPAGMCGAAEAARRWLRGHRVPGETA